MDHAPKALILSGILLLGGCSLPQQAEETPAPAEAAAGPALAATSQDRNLTGSRIPNPQTTDRVLRSVGQQEVRNAMDSAPRPLQTN
ncbi:hypothetical protein B0920_07180 [Massilia sp. KIM]|uniref:hypothetical protein n=1 Tax=Massilia sp. KIM TaxID=1955422 RepID=UPI00098EBF6D|nr:hypothetical protein [Massilia sp. KIM]OON63180.1 hypothetical protein B0920_07180 [Massilia sp. KIM]